MSVATALPIKNTQIPIAYLYLGAIALGIISGFSPFVPLQQFGLIISDVFIKIFKCISLPIISLSLIVTVSQYSTDFESQKIWQKTLFYTITTTIVAATVAALLYLLISPANINQTATMAATTATGAQQSYWDYLINLIPSSIFSPFLENQVMSALFVSMIIGIAIRYIPDEDSRKAISCFFKGTHGVFLVITRWIVKIIPIALFGFITTTIVQLNSGIDISGLGGYLTIVVLANVIQGLIILPLFFIRE